LIDGNRLPRIGGLGPGGCGSPAQCSAEAIIGGDAIRPVIGAASILAKTARDAYMTRMDALYPHYAFASHKGYGTPLHRRRLDEHGPCPLHRRSFAPVFASAAASAAAEVAEATALAAAAMAGDDG
jgi:ribonuclease HII